MSAAPAPYYDSGDGRAVLHLGDALDVLRALPAGSVDAVVTDPPYELADDGKASPYRVFAELVLPQEAKVVSDPSGSDHLPSLITEVLGLRGVRVVPRPPAAVPVGAVALNDEAPAGDEKIEDAGVRAVGVAQGDGAPDDEPEAAIHLGCFALELADPVPFYEALDSVGTGFLAGGIGIGLSVGAPRLSTAPGALSAVHVGDEYVRTGDDPFPQLVCTPAGAEDPAVARFELGRGAVDRLSADGALVFLAAAQFAGAKLVRAGTGARRLPAVLEARRISVVDGATGRALSFDLVVRPQRVTSKGFMGKRWDGSKVAYDVALWTEVFRVLKPGGRLLAFGGTRTSHRMICAIEDAGFQIEDSVCWIFGSGFPKHKSKLKPGYEPVCVARKGGVSLLNVDACRIDGGARPAVESLGNRPSAGVYGEGLHGSRAAGTTTLGRYPANVAHDGSEEVLAAFPAAPGQRAAATGNEPTANGFSGPVSFSGMRGRVASAPPRLDSGSAARFFYAAKASRAEREEGLAGLPVYENVDLTSGDRNRENERAGTNRNGPIRARNIHPTVKPVALMRWLCRLVTPPGGVVLDPFAGSGTTGVACAAEGFRFIGVEREAEYAAIAERRLSHALSTPTLFA